MLKRSSFALTAALIILLLNCGNLLSTSTTSYNFLRFNSSARATALAGAFVAMTDDASAVFFNPASISTVQEKKLSLTFFKHVSDINSGQTSYIHEFEKAGIFAASVSYTNYGSFDKADINGNKDGTFSANDLAMGVTYSNKIDTNLYYGVTMKFVFSTIESYNSSALAFDVGLIYSIPKASINIGASILHSGFQLSKFAGISESLPLDVRVGINHRLKGLPLLINFSLNHLADNEDSFFNRLLNFSIGGEFYFGKYFQARIGYDNQVRRLTSPEGSKELSGFCGGVGLKLKDFNIDYGLANVGISAILHRFSLNLNL